jgi:hypothetical protein
MGPFGQHSQKTLIGGCVLVHAEKLPIGLLVIAYVDFAVVDYFEARMDRSLRAIEERFAGICKLEDFVRVRHHSKQKND